MNIRVGLKNDSEQDTETGLKSSKQADEDTQKDISVNDPVVNDALNIFDGKILKNKGR